MCSQVPRHTGARLFIQAALGCVAVGLLWFLASACFNGISSPDRFRQQVSPSFAALSGGVICGYAVFALFLSKLNSHLGSNWAWPISIAVVSIQGLYAVWCSLAASNPVDWAFPALAVGVPIATVVVTYGGLTWLTSDTWELVKQQAQGRR